MDTIIELEEAVQYLRYELDDMEEEQKQEIQAFIVAAHIYLKNSGCVLKADDEMAKLAIKMLIVHWDENREPIGETKKLAYGLQSLIIQLQYCYDESSGTA
ncbi:head-tail connector protein [Priestia aryabhattai]|uniref:head-tail connector protein n=1 Tax=Priestia aryabhattai TaxID=412384 RepID=UPI0023B0F7A0|nr:head-tail connector protein [Priestia aryabhattai]MDE8676457.1 head-tail connector protein [Priestia aryabhattai]